MKAPAGHRGHIGWALRPRDIREMLPAPDELKLASKAKYSVLMDKWLIDNSSQPQVVYAVIKTKTLADARERAGKICAAEGFTLYCAIGNTGKGMIVGAGISSPQNLLSVGQANARACAAMDWLRDNSSM